MKPILKLWDHPTLLSLNENYAKIEDGLKWGKKR